MKHRPPLFLLGLLLLTGSFSAAANGQTTHPASSVVPGTTWTPVTVPLPEAPAQDSQAAKTLPKDAAEPKAPADRNTTDVSQTEHPSAPILVTAPQLEEVGALSGAPNTAPTGANRTPVGLHWALVVFRPHDGSERPAPLALQAAGSAASIDGFVNNLKARADAAIQDQGMTQVTLGQDTPFGQAEATIPLSGNAQLTPSTVDAAIAATGAKTHTPLAHDDPEREDKGAGAQALAAYLDSFRKDSHTPTAKRNAGKRTVRSNGQLTLIQPPQNAELSAAWLAHVVWSTTRSDSTTYDKSTVLPQETSQSIDAHIILPANRISVVAVVVVADADNLVDGVQAAQTPGGSAIRYAALVLWPGQMPEAPPRPGSTPAPPPPATKNKGGNAPIPGKAKAVSQQTSDKRAANKPVASGSSSAVKTVQDAPAQNAKPSKDLSKISKTAAKTVSSGAKAEYGGGIRS